MERLSLSLFLSQRSVRGTWREGSFTGDPEGYIKEGSGDRHLSPQGPHCGTREGTLLYQGLCVREVRF